MRQPSKTCWRWFREVWYLLAQLLSEPSFGVTAPLPRRPEHGLVRRSSRNEVNVCVSDLEAKAPIPGDVTFRHGFQLARLPRLIRKGKNRPEEPGGDAKALRRWINADDLEIPVRLGGMQARDAGGIAQEPTR